MNVEKATLNKHENVWALSSAARIDKSVCRYTKN